MHNKLPNIRSNDGRFHNGNPATGSLGTIVDDVWLNNVQDSLQDFFDELNNVLALVSAQANPAKKTQVAEAIATLIGNVRRVADSNTRSLQNVIYNSKKSNAINSPSSDTVATSYAVKTLNDKIKYIYNVVKSNNIPINLDLTSRDQIIAEMGGNYQGIGVYRFTFHNLVNHNISGLPLGDIKGAVAIELEVMGGFSRMSCQYLYANRLFFTHVDWNKPTLTLRWYEVVSQNADSVVHLRNTEKNRTNSIIITDDSVDMSRDLDEKKMISTYEVKVGKHLKSAYRTHLLTNKNAEIELSGKDANDAWKRFLTMLTATGNVIVGHNADNGRDRLQINGTVRATAPATNANNDQLPTTAWVNSALDKLVNSDGYVKRGGNKHNIELSWQPDGLHLRVDVTSLGALVLSSSVVGQVAFFASSTPPSGWLKANGAAVSRTTYAALFARIGTRFGAGDGSTTFNLPDLRGEFIRGWDDGRNIDAGRGLGSHQGDAIRNIVGEMKADTTNSGSTQFIDNLICSGAFDRINGNKAWTGDSGGWAGQAWGAKFDASRVVPTANENRPRNIALLACIKY